MKSDDIINTMSLGEKIQYFREKSGLTQKELADKLTCYNKDYISLIETNKRYPNIKCLVDIANILSIDYSYFSLDNLSFGESITYLRELHGYTQLELAQKIDISNTNLSRIESDYIEPSHKIKCQLAELFNMPLKELCNFHLESSTCKSNKLFLGDKIRYYRKKAELTQRELAEKMGIPKSYISLFELNKKCPDRSILSRISEVLGIDSELLLIEF